MIPPNADAILALLDDTPLANAEAVLNRLTAVQELLDIAYDAGAAPNAIHAFNFLYLDITSNIVQWLEVGRFAYPRGLNALDVNFYARYQTALRAYLLAGQVSKCWAHQFDCDLPHHRPMGLPGEFLPSQLQMAAAGVNAHVNCDLAQAVVRTWNELNIDESNEDFTADYTRVNQIFFARIPELVHIYEQKDPLHGLHLEGRIPFQIDNDAVVGCRALAWQAARWLYGHDVDNPPGETAGLLDKSAAVLCDFIVSPGVSEAVFGNSRHPNALEDRAGYWGLPVDPENTKPDLECGQP